MRQFVFFDTTAFISARDLETASWQRIADAIEQNVLEAATSTIVVQEASRQAVNDVREHFQDAAELSKKLRHLGVAFSSPPQPADDVARDHLPKWLKTAGVSVIDIPPVPHQDIVTRDLEVKPPFAASKSGKGYRDTLIWLTLREWISVLHERGESHLYFVTNNVRDFCAPSGQLKDELDSEIPSDFVVTVVRKPQELSSLLVLPQPPSTDQIVTSAAVDFVNAKLGGRSLIPEEFVSRYITLSLVDDITVSSVDADDGEAQLQDELDGETQLWTVEVRSSVGLEGFAYKGDVPYLDEFWYVTEADWNSHYAAVAAETTATITVDVRIEADGETAESEITDVIID